ncbi:sulfotransferase 2A1-like isoform 2-T2 [Molossus nigricans]
MSDGYVWFQGIPFPVVDYTPEHLRAIQENFMFKDDDVLTLSFPKSGTNWLIEILCLIHSKGDPTWIQSVPIWDRSPWMENITGYNALKDKEGPRLMTSHLPIQLFPKSIFKSKTKMIYLIRNPRDILVSGYFFWCISNLVKKPESLEQYFEWFLQGNVAFGSWFDHVRGWMSMKGKENFLVVSYEELQQAFLGTGKITSRWPRLKSLIKHSRRRWPVSLESCSRGNKVQRLLDLTEINICSRALGRVNDWQ